MSPHPVFLLDSREDWHPVAVERSLQATNALVPASFPIRESHKRRTDGIERINFPADMHQPALPAVGYYRVVEHRRLWWHQHWLWFLYNDRGYAGYGTHEGDWELAQIGCADKEGHQPILVTLSQHRNAQSLTWWQTERHHDRPLIFVARGSHAMYPHRLADLRDDADGKGPILTAIEWRTMGAWHNWPGLWGNSTGAGRSPQSPGRQTLRWKTPAHFHAAPQAATSH